MVVCSEDFLCREDFDAVLAIFRSYAYSTNDSESVEKIATNEKDYDKCFFCFTVCTTAANQ